MRYVVVIVPRCIQAVNDSYGRILVATLRHNLIYMHMAIIHMTLHIYITNV